MKPILFFSLLLIILNGCKKNEKALELPGTWEEVLPVNYDTTRNFSTYSIFFDCEKYYKMEVTNFIQRSSEHSCYDTPKYTEYIKGEYTKTKSSFTLKGAFYTDNTYSTLADTNHCYRHGDYEEKFTYTLDSKNLFLNYNNSSNPQINKLKKTSTPDCR